MWEHKTRSEIKEAVEKDSMVIITIGATEQHGPHLPVTTDNLIVNTVTNKSVKKASNYISIIQGPHIPFGYSPHHFLYAGAISLSVQTLLTLLKEVIESILKSGFKKVFIMNSHGGNDEIIRIAAKDLSHENQAQIGAASYWNLAYKSLQEYKKTENIYDVGHAGQFETSLLMKIAPELVQSDHLKKQTKNRKKDNLVLEPIVRMDPGNIWEQMDGYSDEPLKASKEIGETLINIITDEISKKLIKFYGG